MQNTKHIQVTAAVIAILLSFLTVAQQEMAAAQMNIDELWCITCDVEEESREEVQAEQTTEQSEVAEEDVATVDEFIADVSAEREFDDQRIAEEQEENGIPEAENMLSARVVNYYAKALLLNEIFKKLLDNADEIEEESPSIERVEEEVDINEVAQRQIISYEFNEDTLVNDDIRIYTAFNETVQSLARTFIIFTNETDIDLYSNGRMIITYGGESGFDERDNTRIYAPHNYTTLTGYRYTNGTIYDENNIEIFAATSARTIS
jgi:hypothetical protein